MAVIDDVEIIVNHGKIIPEEVWKTREAWKAQEEKSIKEWNAMSEEKQEVLVEKVEKMLSICRGRVEEWIPSGLVVEEGDYIDVTFRMIVTGLDQEALEKEVVSERRIRAALEEARNLADSAPETTEAA